MTVELFLRGIAVGFVIAFALGPIGLLVIRRTIDRGWLYGSVSGTGVAAADATYGAVAAFGLTAVTGLLVGIDRPLGIVGGAILVFLAVRSLRDALRGGSGADSSVAAAAIRAGQPRRASQPSPAAGFASMYGLTMTNPATILSFTALFASIGAGTGGAGGALAVVLGVFTGSIAWWALLTGLVAGLRARLTPRVVRALNIVSAVLIGGFGVVAIALGIAAG